MTNATYRRLPLLFLAFLILCAPALLHLTPAHALQEDDPGWSCARMGNGICGPVRIDPSTRTVHAGNGDFPYTHLEALRGPAQGYCAWGIAPTTHAYRALACAPTLTPTHAPAQGHAHAPALLIAHAHLILNKGMVHFGSHILI